MVSALQNLLLWWLFPQSMLRVTDMVPSAAAVPPYRNWETVLSLSDAVTWKDGSSVGNVEAMTGDPASMTMGERVGASIRIVVAAQFGRKKTAENKATIEVFMVRLVIVAAGDKWRCPSLVN
ncbi:hypothetical protein IV203_014077 [Nitzschia inconspicua]|uniref:Uncharacterized protein n=1 Tax=Nitzschia inconspicua TaxID=303405 RepID=A0A9K3Q7X7_9STRA|nr:hypothetical protein IV203_014077 [Nitzschia inconspicua]